MSRRSSKILRIEGFNIYRGECDGAPSDVEPWIRQFCHQNVWFAAVDADWAADWFNQYGINKSFDEFESAIELISDRHSDDWPKFSEEKITQIHQQALRIYGLLHARWICQPRGMAQMKEKYEQGVFGKCPRFGCHGTKVIPMGQTLTYRRHSAKLFCPKCYDIYRAPPEFVIDGAYFGPAFPHMFLSEYGQFDKHKDFKPFEAKAFGFKIHKSPHSPFKVHDSNKYEVENPDNDEQ